MTKIQNVLWLPIEKNCFILGGVLVVSRRAKWARDETLYLHKGENGVMDYAIVKRAGKSSRPAK